MGEVQPVEAVKSSSSQFNVHSEKFALPKRKKASDHNLRSIKSENGWRMHEWSWTVQRLHLPHQFSRLAFDLNLILIINNFQFGLCYQQKVDHTLFSLKVRTPIQNICIKLNSSINSTHVILQLHSAQSPIHCEWIHVSDAEVTVRSL